MVLFFNDCSNSNTVHQLWVSTAYKFKKSNYMSLWLLSLGTVKVLRFILQNFKRLSSSSFGYWFKFYTDVTTKEKKSNLVYCVSSSRYVDAKGKAWNVIRMPVTPHAWAPNLCSLVYLACRPCPTTTLNSWHISINSLSLEFGLIQDVI